MAWTTPLTATTNGTLTAAQFNSSVRDNLNASEAGIATYHKSPYPTGGTFFATGSHELALRGSYSDSYTTAQSTTSLSYVTLHDAAPAISAPTGTSVLCWITAGMGNSNGGSTSCMSVAVSGATTIAASDEWMASSSGMAAGTSTDNFSKATVCHLFTGLTPGVNTFTCQYKVLSGTGWFQNRTMIVFTL